MSSTRPITRVVSSVRVVPKAAAAPLRPGDFVPLVGEIGGIVETLAELAKAADANRTERARVTAVASVHIERARALRDVMLDYIDRRLSERDATFTALLARFDAAAAAGDPKLAAMALGALVEVAKTSPLAGIGDLAATQRALNDEETEWRI